MNRKSLVFVTLLLCSGAAMAKDQNIASVQVRPESHPSMEVACAGQARLAHADVERLLAIKDRTQTDQLSHRLMGAVSEACNAGERSIAVSRGANGRSLTWRPAREFEANVALR